MSMPSSGLESTHAIALLLLRRHRDATPVVDHTCCILAEFYERPHRRAFRLLVLCGVIPSPMLCIVDDQNENEGGLSQVYGMQHSSAGRPHSDMVKRKILAAEIMIHELSLCGLEVAGLFLRWRGEPQDIPH